MENTLLNTQWASALFNNIISVLNQFKMKIQLKFCWNDKMRAKNVGQIFCHSIDLTLHIFAFTLIFYSEIGVKWKKRAQQSIWSNHIKDGRMQIQWTAQTHTQTVTKLHLNRLICYHYVYFPFIRSSKSWQLIAQLKFPFISL